MSTAMVWGANGSIGRALVERLVAEGWMVWSVGYDDPFVAKRVGKLDRDEPGGANCAAGLGGGDGEFAGRAVGVG